MIGGLSYRPAGAEPLIYSILPYGGKITGGLKGGGCAPYFELAGYN